MTKRLFPFLLFACSAFSQGIILEDPQLQNISNRATAPYSILVAGSDPTGTTAVSMESIPYATFNSLAGGLCVVAALDEGASAADNATALENAITAAAGSQEICIASGTYSIDPIAALTDDVKIVGRGEVVLDFSGMGDVADDAFDSNVLSKVFHFESIKLIGPTQSDAFVDGDVNPATDEITLTTHSYMADDIVYLRTTGTLPAGLFADTTYYVQVVNPNTVQLATSAMGAAVDITAAASGGNHSLSLVNEAAAFNIENASDSTSEKNTWILDGVEIEGFHHSINGRGTVGSHGVDLVLRNDTHLHDMFFYGVKLFVDDTAAYVERQLVIDGATIENNDASHLIYAHPMNSWDINKWTCDGAVSFAFHSRTTAGTNRGRIHRIRNSLFKGENAKFVLHNSQDGSGPSPPSVIQGCTFIIDTFASSVQMLGGGIFQGNRVFIEQASVGTFLIIGDTDDSEINLFSASSNQFLVRTAGSIVGGLIAVTSERTRGSIVGNTFDIPFVNSATLIAVGGSGGVAAAVDLPHVTVVGNVVSSIAGVVFVDMSGDGICTVVGNTIIAESLANSGMIRPRAFTNADSLLLVHDNVFDTSGTSAPSEAIWFGADTGQSSGTDGRVIATRNHVIGANGNVSNPDGLHWLIGGVETGLTASSTDTQGEGQLGPEYEVYNVTATAGAPHVATAPPAKTGEKFTLINNSGSTLKLYPASGDDIGSGVDTADAVTWTTGSVGTYYAIDDTTWYLQLGQ